MDLLPQSPGEDATQLRAVFGLLSPADLAALLALDQRTIAVWRCQKRGPDFVKLGRTVFYRKEDVAELDSPEHCRHGSRRLTAARFLTRAKSPDRRKQAALRQ